MTEGNKLVADFSFLKEPNGIEKLSSYLDELCRDDSVPSKGDFIQALVMQEMITMEQRIKIMGLKEVKPTK